MDDNVNYVMELKNFFDRMPLDLVYMTIHDDQEVFDAKRKLAVNCMQHALNIIETLDATDRLVLRDMIFVGEPVVELENTKPTVDTSDGKVLNINFKGKKDE